MNVCILVAIVFHTLSHKNGEQAKDQNKDPEFSNNSSNI